ncbi:MAG: DUF255 domain-containing protein [Flavobacteriales bacterium]|nr:DUF255 domain-containing protein [Flavobacteriales bacterium]
MKKLIAVILVIGVALFSSSFSQTDETSKPQIKWFTMEQAVKANETAPRKIFFDVYTQWCGWCKRMDATTFQHPQIIEYINENFYAVKFDAESKKEINVNGKKYANPNRTHEFALKMLQGKMSYPSFVVYDETLNNIGIIPGFKSAKDFEPILNYFASNTYKTKSWEEYRTDFKGKIE